MKKDEKVLFGILGALGAVIVGLVVFLIVNGDELGSNTRIVEVGQENNGCYCNIEYFDFDKVTSEVVEKNKQKCTAAVTKLFGADKAEQVQIRYKQQ